MDLRTNDTKCRLPDENRKIRGFFAKHNLQSTNIVIIIFYELVRDVIKPFYYESHLPNFS